MGNNKNSADMGIKDLEKNLDELSALVEKLESGDLSLDEALKQFERGIALTRQAQTALQAAEQKVQVLLANGEAQALAERD